MSSHPHFTKRRFDLLPWDALRAVAYILGFGAEKHGEDAWKQIPTHVHLDKALSHLAYWAEGQKIDPETGHSHLWNAAIRVLFLVSLEINTKPQWQWPVRNQPIEPPEE